MLCSHINIIATQKNPIEKPTKENYGSDYPIVQKFHNLITSPEFLKNPKKLECAKIICFNCNHITTADKLWAHGMAYGKEELLQELLSIFNNGSTQDLTLFTLKTYTELQKKCLNCFKYSGYYIPEQQSSQKF
jgi:hypothetical protein